MNELKHRTERLDKRLTEAEERVSATEDGQIQHGRALSYLLRREANFAVKCDDLENRIRRNNIRHLSNVIIERGRLYFTFWISW